MNEMIQTLALVALATALTAGLAAALGVILARL